MGVVLDVPETSPKKEDPEGPAGIGCAQMDESDSETKYSPLSTGMEIL